MFDSILDFLYGLAAAALSILPDSPFASLSLDKDLGQYGQIMGWINYFIPVGTMLNIFVLYLAAVLIWYGVRWVLRIAQYIE